MTNKETIVDYFKKEEYKSKIIDFIRQKLKFPKELIEHFTHIDIQDFKKEHKRFDMSGEVTSSNLAILNEFIDLGIYNYTYYLFLNFHKGSGTLYYKYYGDFKNQELDLSGYGTTEIIYEIFKKTIFSNKHER